MTLPPAAILTDIEGTTTPIAFVHDVLFPYARARMPDFLAAHPHENLPNLTTLLAWMDADEKIPILKDIQGRIWESGYRSGEIQGAIYPDVPPALQRWSKSGLRLFVYSSGSIAAQKLLFSHTQSGDLTGFFAGFFDTGVGPKRNPASYTLICRGTNISPAECLFLSDIEAELDAAATAGLQTCQLAREPDGTVPSPRHKVARSFAEIPLSA